MQISRISFLFSTHSKVCVIGAGTGGVNFIAQLIRKNISPYDIRVFQPSQHHYYQPGWTMVGGDLCEPQLTVRKNNDVIPQGVAWTKLKVTKVKPSQNSIETQNGQQFTYDHIVFASGIKTDWQKIKGAKELLENENSNVCSIYSYNYATKTARLGKNFKGGKAIFTEPVHPIKCAGAPQKIMYLWTDAWRRKHIPVDVEYVKAPAVMFGVPKYSQALTQIAKDYDIKITFKHNLIEVTQNVATFMNVETNEQIQPKFDFLHLVPPMSPHSYIAESGLGNTQGYLDVNKHTLRHNKFGNVWGIGDCTSLPTSKTAAAIMSETPVLVKQINQYYRNFIKVFHNSEAKELPQSYQGYTSCPLFVSHERLLLAQFKYDNIPDETFFNNQEVPRKSFFWMKRYMFPQIYWNAMPKGLWRGRNGIAL